MDIRAIFMGLCFALMWSSAFTSARVIVTYAPPISALAMRFLVSGLIGVGVAYMLGQSAKLTARQWRAVVVFGLCQNALYLGLNFIAMQWIEASLAAIIASTMPLIVALASLLIFRERLAPLAGVGLLAGIAGVVLIMGGRLQGGVDALGVILCGVAVISLAVATLSVRMTGASGNVLMVVGLQMLVGSAILWPFAIVLEDLAITWNWQLIVAFVYTTLVPGLLATWIWFLLVGRIGATRAATFHFLNPFFGVAVAAVFLGEHLGGLDIAGVAIITLGILAVQVARSDTFPTKA